MTEKVELFLNRSFGGFGFSKDFYYFLLQHKDDLKHDLGDVSDSDIEMDFEDYDDIMVRSSPSLIKLMREFGIIKCAGRNCHYIIIQVDKFVLPFINLQDHRGCETLEFQIEPFWNMLCKAKTPNDEIVESIKLFFASKKATLSAIYNPYK